MTTVVRSRNEREALSVRHLGMRSVARPNLDGAELQVLPYLPVPLPLPRATLLSYAAPAWPSSARSFVTVSSPS